MISWTWTMCRAGQRAGSCPAGGQPQRGLLRGRQGQRGPGSSFPAMRMMVSRCASMLPPRVPNSNPGEGAPRKPEYQKAISGFSASLTGSTKFVCFSISSSAPLSLRDCQLCVSHRQSTISYVGRAYTPAKLPINGDAGSLSQDLMDRVSPTVNLSGRLMPCAEHTERSSKRAQTRARAGSASSGTSSQATVLASGGAYQVPHKLTPPLSCLL